MLLHSNPIATLGQAGLLLTLVLAAYTISACVAGARRGSKRLIRSGLYASFATTAMLTFSSGVMWFLLLSNDYSVKYVQRHSDATMPWYYKLTAFWGGLDGSIMWWVLLLALFASVAIWVNRERHKELIPYVTAILYTVVAFFVMLIIFEKRPFDIFLTEAPKIGKGLNPLLQNPYMATHPPSLYLGFVSATVPFAFGLAALITGNLDDSWVTSTRRWVLISWYFLAQGLILGSLWAYEELGWGGYWGWDPVENAGFLPWLTSTAFLHSIMVQERRGMLKVWNVCLVIVTFLLTIIGTFMTRSGIVQSVHAFGQDNELAVIFLIFIGIVAIFSFGLVIYRLPLLRSRNELDSWVSREFAFLVNNWILLSAAFFILIAVLFPTLSEAVVHERITVGPPFFDKWMAPVGLVLLFLTGVGPLIAWRKASIENLKQQFLFPSLAGLVTGGVLAMFPNMRVESPMFNDHIHLPLAIICFGLCGFVLATIGQEFYRGTRVRQSHTKLDFFTSLIGLVARGKRRYGGYLVHVAIVLMFVGFAGNAYKQESEATLEKGQSITLGGYTVRYDGIEHEVDAQKDMTAAAMTVFKGGKEFAKMAPAKWIYRGHEDEPTTEVDIHKMPKEDLYLILNGTDGNLANIKVVINPLVNWIWIGFLLLALGTAIAFMPDRAYQLAGSAAKGGGKAAATAIILCLCLFGGVAHAQGHMPQAKDMDLHQARSSTEKKLFEDIRCRCGTCTDVLANCNCGSAPGYRAEVQKLLDSGKTPDQVIQYVASHYGEEWLVEPLDKGFNRLAWVLPLGALFGAAGLLTVFARKWTRRGIDTRRAVAAVGVDAPSATEKDDYEARLDDELDDLD